MKIANLAAADEALHRYVSDQRTTNWKFALEEMRALMAELGNPQEKLKIVHIAGTSGKSSTAYYVANMLQRLGQKVGLTVSPHVDGVNERIQINGQPLSEAEFCQKLGNFLDLPPVVKSQASYFGVLIAFAYWLFAEQKIDYAVVEVGIGGRIDATNVVQRADKVSVITDIGFDHMSMLGNTLGAISGEKAMIIQAGNDVFVRQQSEEVMKPITERIHAVSAHLHQLPAQVQGAPTTLI